MRKRNYSQKEKDQFVAEFLSAKTKLVDFCHKHNLPHSSFSKWKSDYLKRENAAFTPLEIVQEKALPDIEHQKVVVRVKLDTLEIDFFSEPSAELLLKLAQS